MIKFIEPKTVLPKYLIQVSRKKSIFAPLSSAILDFVCESPFNANLTNQIVIVMVT